MVTLWVSACSKEASFPCPTEREEGLVHTVCAIQHTFRRLLSNTTSLHNTGSPVQWNLEPSHPSCIQLLVVCDTQIVATYSVYRIVFMVCVHCNKETRNQIWLTIWRLICAGEHVCFQLGLCTWEKNLHDTVSNHVSWVEPVQQSISTSQHSNSKLTNENTRILHHCTQITQPWKWCLFTACPLVNHNECRWNGKLHWKSTVLHFSKFLQQVFKN